MSASHRSLTTLALVALSLPAAAGVLVVDKSGAGEFTSLSAALAASSSGDTLLVRPGNYHEISLVLTVSSKSLVIAADGAGAVLTNPFQVTLGAGQHVVLRGLTIEPSSIDPTTTGLSTSGGDVLVEGCTILGRDGTSISGSAFGGSAVLPTTGHLTLKGCVIEGGRGSDSEPAVFLGSQPGGYGIDVLGNATVAVYGGSVTGGRGGDFKPGGFSPGDGAVGGIAVLASFDANVLLAGCKVTGGHGGNGTANPGNFTASTYQGGDAVNIFNQTKVSLLGATLLAGAPGVDGGGQAGSFGDVIEAGPSSKVVQFPGAYRDTQFGAPTKEGGTLSFDYAGAPGDLVALFVSPKLTTLPLSGKQGFFQLGSPLIGPVLVGPVGGTGALSLGFGLPDLGFGPDDALLLVEQAFVKPASGATLLSSPTTAVLVDDSL